ncbi:SipW-dependent-type signal peptide-containing protein [Clostridium sardiniense]|uniref:SipW-dependent-type signal peptide-containing protein n=1 Tax=Clostridium sardiniense TaxID=29369 RepID=UPI003D32CE62
MKKVGLTLGIVLLISVAAASIAYFTSKETLKNKFKVGSIKTEVIEDFNQNSELPSNKQVPKVVKIKNTGDNPVLVRVIINPQWDEEKDENGKVTKLTTSASNQVQLNFSDTWKKYWIKGNDGYYYYNKVLKPAEKDDKGNIIKEADETSPLLESVSLKDIPNEEKAEYKNRSLTVNVSSEAIQVNDKALEDEWNSNKTMGDVYSQLQDIIKSYNEK